MVIDIMNNLSTNILTFTAAGFLAKRISNHYQNKFKMVEMRHEHKKIKTISKSSNPSLTMDSFRSDDPNSYRFARRAIVISIFWLSALTLFACAYLSIPIVVPLDNAVSIFFGLFKLKTTTLQTANGFLFDYKTIGHQAISIISFYMGCSVCKG